MATFKANPQGGKAGKTGDIMDASFSKDSLRSARINVGKKMVKHDEAREVNDQTSTEIPAAGRR